VTPREREDLEALARHLGVRLAPDAQTEHLLARYALFWYIENGQLPEMDVPISLQRGEVCHYACPASWYELRTRTVRVDYSGFSASVRIAKGLRYRVGSYAPRRVTTEQLTHVDDGTVYFTSKRILFDGAKANKAVPLRSVIAILPMSDGIVIEKATGRSPHIVLRGDVEVTAMILSAALERA
jgi:hypothetical protein